MKTLVTGATGFTGKALCQKLVQKGEQVVAFVRPTSKVAELKASGIECRQVDIKNPAQVQDNFTDITLVYHIAAAYRTEHADRDEFHLVNVEATRNLLTAAKLHNVQRFVHCSTVGVQGNIDEPPASEDYRFSPGDHYQQSKMEGEFLARRYFQEGLPGTVVRPTAIYGPGDTRFLKLFRAIKKGYFVMIGNGATLYHLNYIDDLVDGIILAGSMPTASGEVFTLGGEHYTSIKQLVKLISEILGKPPPRLRVPFFPVYVAAVACDRLCRPLGIHPPIYPRRVEFFHKHRAFTIAKARDLLGYQPRVGLREGLGQTAAWYHAQGLL
jgi:nucleoside-diphosphate-sugar epimerase